MDAAWGRRFGRLAPLTNSTSPWRSVDAVPPRFCFLGIVLVAGGLAEGATAQVAKEMKLRRQWQPEVIVVKAWDLPVRAFDSRAD
jgi:hypothetical protein